MARLNRCFIPQAHEWIAGTFAVRAFFIAVISGCWTACTFAAIKFFSSNCVNAAAALFATGLATTTVCDPHVVTSAATLCTTRSRQFSLPLLLIRPCWCVHLFHTGRRPDKVASPNFLLTNPRVRAHQFGQNALVVRMGCRRRRVAMVIGIGRLIVCGKGILHQIREE